MASYGVEGLLLHVVPRIVNALRTVRPYSVVASGTRNGSPGADVTPDVR